MGKPLSYLFGMLIAIMGGTFFFVVHCSECQPSTATERVDKPSLEQDSFTEETKVDKREAGLQRAALPGSNP